jgi:hypothetical protein
VSEVRIFLGAPHESSNEGHRAPRALVVLAGILSS